NRAEEAMITPPLGDRPPAGPAGRDRVGVPLLSEPREQVFEPEPPQEFVRVPPPYRTVGDMSRGRTFPGSASNASPSRRLEAGHPGHRPIARSPNEPAAVQRPGEESARDGLGGTATGAVQSRHARGRGPACAQGRPDRWRPTRPAP